MAGRGDLNLARELRAEFGRAKPPRSRGRRSGDGDRIFQTPSESQYQYQQPSRRSEHAGFNQGMRIRGRGRGRAHHIVHPPRPAWQGGLVTSVSPGMSSQTVEASMFFHRPSYPRPPTPPSFTRATASLTPTIQQLNNQQLRQNIALDFSIPADRDGAGAFGMPWYQTTNQSSPGALFNTIPSTSTVPFQENRPPYNEQAEEQDDTETESVDHISTVASKSVTTDTSKGLAGSMWNPVNMNARTDSRGSSQALFKVGSDTTKKMPIVTSGITKGPGLKASRWSE